MEYGVPNKVARSGGQIMGLIQWELIGFDLILISKQNFWKPIEIYF